MDLHPLDDFACRVRRSFINHDCSGTASQAIGLEVHHCLHGRVSDDRSDDFVLDIVGRSALFDEDLDERVANRSTMVI